MLPLRKKSLRLYQRLSALLKNIWACADYRNLAFGPYVFFLILCFVEGFYRFCFFVFRKISLLRAPYVFNAPVISIGNISVGGTGKSVFVAFVMRQFSDASGIIVMRGYKGKNEQGGRSFLASDGKRIFSSPSFCGDEAAMLAWQTGRPVVVGSARKASLELAMRLLRSWRLQPIDFVVLDDAYQNATIKKDLEIVLLDARHPFENGHCLPAGRLREKDLSRADIVILTHSENQAAQSLRQSRALIAQAGFKGPVFEGMHKPLGFFGQRGNFYPYSFLKGKRVGIFAGLGSFSSFFVSVAASGAQIVFNVEFQDHHAYSSSDFTSLVQEAVAKDCEYLVTTCKDWVKLSSECHDSLNMSSIEVVYLEIAFSFLDENDNKKFHDNLKKLIG